MKASRIVLSFAAGVICLILPLSAFPQEFPKYEIGGAFSYSNMEEFDWFGWKISGARNFNHYFGIAVDIAGLDGKRLDDISYFTYKSSRSRYFFLAGPKLANRNLGNWVPYLHFLAGAVRTSSYLEYFTREGESLFSSSDTIYNFAMALGGGLDYRLKGPLAIRLVRADLLHSYGNGGWERGGMISCGLVFRLGSSGL